MPAFIPGAGGDANGDGKLNITDAVATLGHLFLGASAPRCLHAADANDDGKLNTTDPVATLGHLFLGGPPLAWAPRGAPAGRTRRRATGFRAAGV